MSDKQPLLALILQYGEECVADGSGGYTVNTTDRVLQQIKNRLTAIPEQAVQTIVADLQDRAGLGDAWDDIDEDIQTEIVEAWAKAIQDTL